LWKQHLVSCCGNNI